LAPTSGRGGWAPVVHEPYTGAWQRNAEQSLDSVVAAPMVFVCVTKIMSDIGKVQLRLVRQTEDRVWVEAQSSAFSPVLKKPNRYQTRIKFVEYWIASKLLHGNAYALKARDARGVVTALYLLDPTRVCPLVTPNGDVYYELRRDDLSGVGPEVTGGGDVITVPSTEIIHDLMYALFHPLIGVSPIFACGMIAGQQQAIAAGSKSFFANGAQPGGILTAPGAISEKTAQELKEYWNTNFTGDNSGKVAVVGDGLKYERLTMSASDSQLIEQLNWSGQTICGCFGMPPYLAGIGPAPPFGPGPLLQLYYNETLQPLMTSLEVCMDEGLELPDPYGTEFYIPDLIWMDPAAQNVAAAEGIKGGGMAPDEARQRYYGLGKTAGGDTPYMQQQMFSLAALAERDAAAPFAKAAPAAPAVPAVTVESDDLVSKAAFIRATETALRGKGIEIHAG
jgi:HK97 family phage portal protein